MFLDAVAEVRTNGDETFPDANDVHYARNFLGEVPVVSLAFSDHRNDLKRLSDGVMAIGLDYAMKWIEERIAWMKKHEGSFTKSGSWVLSDDALSDILVRLKRR